MPDTIFVPVDPTTRHREMTALNQVEDACAFSSWHGGQLKLFHLQEPAPRMNHTATKVLGKRMTLKREIAQAFLQKVEERSRQRGVTMESSTKKGAGAKAILEAAEDDKSALIFMMTHSGSTNVLERLGSMSSQILLHSSLPVVVVKPSMIHSSAPDFAPPQTLLVPVKVGLWSAEEQSHNERVVEYALKMAKRWLCDIKLLSVVEVPYVQAPELGALLFADDFAAERQERKKSATEALQHLMKHISGAGVQVEFEVSQNARGIIGEIDARVESGTWLCMATHHQNRAISALMGSVSLSMAKHSKRPVLFLPRALTH